MYKRLTIVSLIILAGLCGLCTLGWYSIGLHAESLRARRANEFIAVAEQIRLDVKRKLDEFIAAEQNRPYTDYQYFYIPFAANDASALVRSPLAENLDHGLAYGYFQIDADGAIVSPYNLARQVPDDPQAARHLANIQNNLLKTLSGAGPTIQPEKVEEIAFNQQIARAQTASELARASNQTSLKADTLEEESKAAASKARAAPELRRGQYPIESLETQASQVLTQSRDNVTLNIYENVYDSYRQQQRSPLSAPRHQQQYDYAAATAESPAQARPSTQTPPRLDNRQTQAAAQPPTGQAPPQPPTIQIRIEPFRPIVVPDPDQDTLIGGQVFLLRHVQIEQRHFIQGFLLNETELVNQVAESAARHVLRRDMHFDISPAESPAALHTAILDFGFADLALNLFELNPRLIADQISSLRRSFFAVVAFVFLAVTLAQISLWRTARAHIRLAKKKDDFISAVSHELRTPLTTIRMHTEMLEKGWIKNEAKRTEYYAAMRQETERLTRLIENVLDFSRIQRRRKKYHFKLGDVNASIAEVLDMMTPCAARQGFTIQRDLAPVPPFAFDADAVMQIVINLLDNALKYARPADEKTISVRTRSQNGYALIEVEDRGPGIPRLQRKKIFEEFYRCQDESKRETTGTGLGLALVKRFAQAHNGFVEVLNARPTGAIFRVALTQK